ncbi:MAG: GntR family transcriptional regulator [Bacilli bacterium]|nr:GntR family transcriptional regulator [Bacilli bacterium]
MNIVFDNDRPIYIQLVEGLQIHIISGMIFPGERLPSVRELALNLKVNPNTMQKALSELEDLGLIYTERTNGKFVTTDKSKIEKLREKYAREKTSKYINDIKELGLSKKDIINLIKEME